MKNIIKPGLYVTATPIGNLSDITDRAKKVLEKADIIACEDTRVTGKLLMALGIKSNLVAFHEHNESKIGPRLLEKIQDNAIVALVSDAGTPLISDPGYKLVEEAQNQNIPVIPIPGPSALTAALSISGLPTDRFLFMGFPPGKSSARKEWFEGVKKIKSSLVFYESTRRLPESLNDASFIFGNRAAAVCREMTKTFEEVRKADLKDLSLYYSEHGAPKGECVVVIGPPTMEIQSSGQAEIDIDSALTSALGYLKVKDAATLISEITGQKRKALYAKALELKEGVYNDKQ